MRQAVDVSSLMELRQLQQPGKPDAIARIVDHFLAETSQRLATLHRAITTGDAKLLEQAAHALKGISGTGVYSATVIPSVAGLPARDLRAYAISVRFGDPNDATERSRDLCQDL